MTRPLPNELFHVLLAEAVPGDNLRMLRADDHDRFRSRRSVHPVGKVGEDSFAFGAIEIRGAYGAIRAYRRYRACVGAESAPDVERLPGARFFVFRDAETIFSRPAKCGLARGAGIGTADVSLNEANATADGSVSPPTLAENV